MLLFQEIDWNIKSAGLWNSPKTCFSYFKSVELPQRLKSLDRHPMFKQIFNEIVHKCQNKYFRW